MTAVAREFCDARMQGLEYKVDALSTLMRREIQMMESDRERARHELADRLDGMNHLQSKIDEQSKTMAPRERVESLERTTQRTLAVIAGIVVAFQVVTGLLLWLNLKGGP